MKERSKPFLSHLTRHYFVLATLLCTVTLTPVIAKEGNCSNRIASVPQSIGATNAFGGSSICSKWLGRVHSDQLNSAVTAVFNQRGNKLEGCLVCESDGEISKHYIRGYYDAANDDFIFQDIGIDMDSANPKCYPAPVEKYQLRLTDGGRKLVGHCKQAANQTLWINLAKQPGTQLKEQDLQIDKAQTFEESSESIATNLRHDSSHSQYSYDAISNLSEDNEINNDSHSMQSSSVKNNERSHLERGHQTFLIGQQAMKLVHLGKYREAQLLYQKACMLDPNLNSASIHCDLAYTFQMQGDADSAIAEYKKALSFDPHYELALFNLGTCYMNAGRNSEAKTHLIKLVTLYPESSKRAEAEQLLSLFPQGPREHTNIMTSPTLPLESRNRQPRDPQKLVSTHNTIPKPAPDFRSRNNRGYSQFNLSTETSDFQNEKLVHYPHLNIDDYQVSAQESHVSPISYMPTESYIQSSEFLNKSTKFMGGQDYFSKAIEQGMWRWHKESLPIKVYIEPGVAVRGYRDVFRSALITSFDDWVAILNYRLQWSLVPNRDEADIVCRWISDKSDFQLRQFNEQGETYHFAYPSGDNEAWIKSATITICTLNIFGMMPLSNAEVLKVCKHEVGHALGIRGHSQNPKDVMFGTCRTIELTSRDAATINRLYADYPSLIRRRQMAYVE